MPVGKVEGGDSQQPSKWVRADIKKNADGESDMRAKLEQRYKERYDAVKEKMNAETHQEMVEKAGEENKARINIADHRKLKDYTVIINPHGPEILATRSKLEEQSRELDELFAKEIFPKFKHIKEKITPPLAPGRVKMGPPSGKDDKGMPGIPAA